MKKPQAACLCQCPICLYLGRQAAVKHYSEGRKEKASEGEREHIMTATSSVRREQAFNGVQAENGCLRRRRDDKEAEHSIPSQAAGIWRKEEEN